MSKPEVSSHLEHRKKPTHLLAGALDDVGQGPRCNLAGPQRASVCNGAPAALCRHHQCRQRPDGTVRRQRPPRLGSVPGNVACAAAALFCAPLPYAPSIATEYRHTPLL